MKPGFPVEKGEPVLSGRGSAIVLIFCVRHRFWPGLILPDSLSAEIHELLTFVSARSLPLGKPLAICWASPRVTWGRSQWFSWTAARPSPPEAAALR